MGLLPRAAAFAAAALILFTATVVPASPSESHPDCEPDQPDRAAGTPLVVCEGEHWDGQDPYAEDQGLVIRYGAPGSPSPTEPASAGVHLDGEGVFVFGTLHGAGEAAVHVDANARALAFWGRDGSDALLRESPVFVLFVIVDDALGRDNPGADGNAVAWVVGVSGTLTRTAGAPAPAGEETGEGDCDQATYGAEDCTRDDTAVTIILP